MGKTWEHPHLQEGDSAAVNPTLPASPHQLAELAAALFITHTRAPSWCPRTSILRALHPIPSVTQ